MSHREARPRLALGLARPEILDEQLGGVRVELDVCQDGVGAARRLASRPQIRAADLHQGIKPGRQAVVGESDRRRRHL